MFQESFKGVSRKIEGCFNGVLREIQGCLKEFQWVFKARFQRCFKNVLKELSVSRKIERCLRDLQWCFKGAGRVSKRSSNGVSRQFQRRFKEVSRVLKKVSTVFLKRIFKGVSRMFQ